MRIRAAGLGVAIPVLRHALRREATDPARRQLSLDDLGEKRRDSNTRHVRGGFHLFDKSRPHDNLEVRNFRPNSLVNTIRLVFIS